MTAYYVSPSGNDAHDGSSARPFRTIAAAIGALEPGDILNLCTGHYLEQVRIRGKHGTATDPIVIRSQPGQHATIDGCLPTFQLAGNDDWEPASLTDPDAHEDEYISRPSFALPSENDRVFRGAFLDREPYTRLITYHRLDDFRSENQTWNELDLTDRRGHEALNDNGTSRGYRRLPVYMGPGICVPNRSFPSTGRIHIRMSPTENRIAGLADYDGETDPRQVPLAISRARSTPLLIQSSNHVRFEDLSIRFGGATSVRIEKSEGIVFDHVRVLTGTSGIMLRATTNTILRHCEVRGGLPEWFFRSDRKGEYWLRENEALVVNLLGKQTLNALIAGSDNRDLEIHHCELVDGHDLILGGERISFHHNWLHNLNDDAMFLDIEWTADVRIFENVITRCLTGMSFAGKTHVGGRRFVYRNLFDLRAPTAGNRPRFPGDMEALRFGQFFKGGSGPLDIFQNTCVVCRQHSQASYRHYRNTLEPHPRRTFNNIFVAINPDERSDRPIAFLPPPTFPGPTDGNRYFRLGHATAKLLRLEREEKGFDLESMPPGYVEQSQAQYPPGFETSSKEVDPLFRRRLRPDGLPHPLDDLRLRQDSPARTAGIRLDDELRELDPHAPAGALHPDIGCYAGDERLRVGVDGRREFPAELQPLPPPL